MAQKHFITLEQFHHMSLIHSVVTISSTMVSSYNQMGEYLESRTKPTHIFLTQNYYLHEIQVPIISLWVPWMDHGCLKMKAKFEGGKRHHSSLQS